MKSAFILVVTSEHMHYERSLLKIWISKAMHSNVVSSNAVCIDQSRLGWEGGGGGGIRFYLRLLSFVFSVENISQLIFDLSSIFALHLLYHLL